MVLLQVLTIAIQWVLLSTWGWGGFWVGRGPRKYKGILQRAGWAVGVESLRERKSVEAAGGLRLVCL